MHIHTFYTSALTFALRAAAFNLYPTVNPDSLAKSFGISIGCLDTLNETVACEQTLFQMVNTVDSYLWTTENVTDLCTTACIASTTKWWSDVQDRCAMDNIVAYSKMIPAASVAGRFFDGLSIACLQSGASSNSSGSYSNTTTIPTGSGPFSNTTTSASTKSGPYSNSSSASNVTSSERTWCLIESQEWVGSDIIRPDCSTDSTDPSCLDPLTVSPENERIANLYPNDMLCSDCFIRMFYQRMTSPYLPDSEYSDYLVAQYQDILDVCKATMPQLVIRTVPFYGDAPVAIGAASPGGSTMPVPSSFGIQYTNGTNSTTTCTGQTIRMADVNVHALSMNTSLCDLLSKKYSVTTGDLGAVLGNPYCEPAYLSYCVPAACTLMRVRSGASCDSIASSNAITTLQFSNWNPNINGLCDNLREGDFVCIGAPGGSYVPPPISRVAGNSSIQQPGGTTGNSTGPSKNSTAPFQNSTIPFNTASSQPSASSSDISNAPSPTQKGISSSCTRYSQVKSGDYCSTFAQANNITPAQLYTLNGALGSTGQNCNTAFWSGYYYCVASIATPAPGGYNSTNTTTAMSTVLSTLVSTIDSVPTSAITISPDPISTPLSTIMSTIISTVDAIPLATGISSSPLTPVPTPTVGNAAFAIPSPVQVGISSLCAKYTQAHPGDTCSSFATANGIALLDLYERNTALGSTGENCGTKFWSGYYYCVGGTD